MEIFASCVMCPTHLCKSIPCLQWFRTSLWRENPAACKAHSSYKMVDINFRKTSVFFWVVTLYVSYILYIYKYAHIFHISVKIFSKCTMNCEILKALGYRYRLGMCLPSMCKTLGLISNTAKTNKTNFKSNVKRGIIHIYLLKLKEMYANVGAHLIVL